LSDFEKDIVLVEVADGLKIKARGKFCDKDALDFMPSAGSPHFYVDTPNYDGPLDLLLHLIRKHSLDIFDIPIVLITSKYLEAIDDMASKNLDIAGEFLLMAATLLEIKSACLLPKEEASLDFLNEEKDPRSELVMRLLIYKTYKEAADFLMAQPKLSEDIFLKGFDEYEKSEEIKENIFKLKPLPTGSLIETWSQVLKRKGQNIAHVISAERVSITARIRELMELCSLMPKISFLEAAKFFSMINKIDTIVTFLAILEMVKLGWLKISKNDCEIFDISVNKTGSMLYETADKALKDLKDD